MEPRPGVKGQPALKGPSVSIDMANEKDRGTVREATKRFPRRFRAMDDKVQNTLVKGMVEATDAARKQLKESMSPTETLSAVDALASLVRTGAMIVAIQQKDDHKAQELDLKQREVETGEKLVKQYDGIDPSRVGRGIGPEDEK